MNGGAATRQAALRGVIPTKSGALLVPVFVLAALAVGALSTTRPLFAAAIVGVAGTAFVVASSIDALPPLLVLTMFAEGVSLGGIHIGRLVGVLTLAAIAYYLLVRRRADLRASPLLVVACATAFWILLSIYWASNDHLVYVTFFKWALSFAFTLAFAVLIRGERQLKTVLVAFVVAAALSGLVAVVEFLTSGGVEYGTGLQGDHNLFAAYQVLALPIALVLAGLERSPQLRLAYYAAVAFIVVSVSASFSRGGLIALGVVVAGTVVLPWRLFFRRSGQKLAYLLSLVFAGWIVALLGSTQYLERIQSIFGGPDRGSGRLDLWAAAWNGYTHHPWLGLGAGGFEAHSLDLLRTTPGVASSSLLFEAQPTHNAYLEALTDLGPIGLTIFLLLVVLSLGYLLRAARRYGSSGNGPMLRMTSALIVSFVGLLAASFFLSIELGKPIWIFVGLALALDRMSSRQLAAGVARRRARPSRRGAGGAAPVQLPTRMRASAGRGR